MRRGEGNCQKRENFEDCRKRRGGRETWRERERELKRERVELECFFPQSSVCKLASTSQSCFHKEIYKTGFYRPAFQACVSVYVRLPTCWSYFMHIKCMQAEHCRFSRDCFRFDYISVCGLSFRYDSNFCFTWAMGYLA